MADDATSINLPSQDEEAFYAAAAAIASKATNMSRQDQQHPQPEQDQQEQEQQQGSSVQAGHQTGQEQAQHDHDVQLLHQFAHRPNTDDSHQHAENAYHDESHHNLVPAPATYDEAEAQAQADAQAQVQAEAQAHAQLADNNSQTTKPVAGQKRKRGANFPVGGMGSGSRSNANKGPRTLDRTKRITRSRKVNSCLQCRAKKQKCDRQHPVCGNCQLLMQGKNGAIKGETIRCEWLDAPLEGATVAERERDGIFAAAAAVAAAGAGEGAHAYSAALPPAFAALVDGAKHVKSEHQVLVQKAYQVSRDPAKDFSTRVKAARSAVVGWILATNHLSLPQADRAIDLMDIYEKNIAWYCAIVLPDLVGPRLQQFLTWFHGEHAALPGDPPFVPLALVLLALTLQAIRTTGDSRSLKHLVHGAPPSGTGSVADVPVEPGCSTERQLLEIAGRCIDGLQVACPSAWASAYQAPIDLVKAALLRGLWHLNEQHTSFAGTCFAIATRLAYAAGLNRDPKHWSSISPEEAQARRNLWWNVVYFETMHTTRNNTPSSIHPASFDVDLPTDYEALKNIYDNAIRHQSQAQLGGVPITRPYRQPHPHRAMGLASLFALARVQLQQEAQMMRANHRLAVPSQSLIKTMSSAWDAFRVEMPPAIRQMFDSDSKVREQNARDGKPACGPSGPYTPGSSGSAFASEGDRIDWLQRSILQLLFWQGQMTIHRPYADDEWKREARGNLDKCLVAAQCISWLVADILARDPPFSLVSVASYHTFAAGVIMAIFVRVDPRNSRVPAVQAALEKANECLRTIAKMDSLGNVAEQANRYASALEEMRQQPAGQRAPEVQQAPVTDQASTANAIAVPPPASSNGMQDDGSADIISMLTHVNATTSDSTNTANLNLLGNLAEVSSKEVGSDAQGQKAQQDLANLLRTLDGSTGEHPVPGNNYNYALGPSAAANLDPAITGPSTSGADTAATQSFSPAASDLSTSEIASQWTSWERYIDSILLNLDVSSGVDMSALTS